MKLFSFRSSFAVIRYLLLFGHFVRSLIHWQYQKNSTNHSYSMLIQLNPFDTIQPTIHIHLTYFIFNSDQHLQHNFKHKSIQNEQNISDSLSRPGFIWKYWTEKEKMWKIVFCQESPWIFTANTQVTPSPHNSSGGLELNFPLSLFVVLIVFWFDCQLQFHCLRFHLIISALFRYKQKCTFFQSFDSHAPSKYLQHLQLKKPFACHSLPKVTTPRSSTGLRFNLLVSNRTAHRQDLKEVIQQFKLHLRNIWMRSDWEIYLQIFVNR